MKLADVYKKLKQNEKYSQQNASQNVQSVEVHSTAMSNELEKGYEEKIKNLTEENKLLAEFAEKLEQKNIALQEKIAELEGTKLTGEDENQELSVLDVIRIISEKTEQKMKLDLEINRLQTKHGIGLTPTSADSTAPWEKATPVTDGPVEFGLSTSNDNIEKLTNEFQNLDASEVNDIPVEKPLSHKP